MMLGCDISSIDNETRMKFEKDLNESLFNYPSQNYQKLTRGAFYRDFSQFLGLCDYENVTIETNKEANEMLTNIVKTLLKLLRKQLPISDDMMIFCFECCKLNNNQLMEDFVSVLRQVTHECLASSSKFTSGSNDGINDGSSNYNIWKARRYAWFKEYLLHSNVWFCKYNKLNDKTAGLLYNVIESTIEEELTIQQQFIWDNIIKAQESDEKSWDELVRFGSNDEKGKKTEKEKEEQTVLRQDKIENGIISDENEKELYLISLEMDQHNEMKQDFDVFSEFTTKVYLTKCLVFAHANNGIFQNKMKEYFSLDKNASFASAPVKKYDRCVIKSSTDYRIEKFPNASHILDFLRCSVTYPTMKHLLNGLNNFVLSIKNNYNINDDKKKGENYLSCIRKIVRIKNGFENISKYWKSCNDAEYCDIKLNVIYVSNEAPYKQMIVEIQFLLKFLLKAKKMGHKLYNIKRRKTFINNVTNQVYNIDCVESKFKNKINQMIENGDVNYFSKQLFLQANKIISIINFDGVYTYYPIMETIGQTNNTKLFEIFLSNLYHFNYEILDKNNNNNNYNNITNTNDSSQEKNLLSNYFNFMEYQISKVLEFVKYWCISVILKVAPSATKTLTF